MRNSLLLISLFITCQLFAQVTPRGVGRVVIPADFADPSVIFANGKYYAVGTSSEWAPHYPIYTSTDLLTWKQVAYVFNKKPAWTKASFWAPELYYHNGKFMVYYTARKASDNTSCIGVATADDPEKGFTDHGILLETGKEAIDAFVVKDGNALYITWKAYGLDDRPIEILGATLSGDGLKLTGAPFTLYRDDARKGLEGQCIVKQGGYFYMFYSIGGCCGAQCSYAVNVARSATMRGKFEDYAGNPVLKDDGVWKCPGHGTLVQSPKKEWYFLYHAYNVKDNVHVGRQGMLAMVDWSKGWPSFQADNIQAKVSSTVASSTKSGFDQIPWSYDFRHADPQVSNDKATIICFTGEVDAATNATGTVFALRASSSNYSWTGTISSPSENGFAGLTIYGDAGESIGVGIKGKDVEVWSIRKNIRTVLGKANMNDVPSKIKLKIETKDGTQFKFAWSVDNTWTDITTSTPYVDGTHLPQWDRAPRIGFYYNGDSKGQTCVTDWKLQPGL